MQAQPTTRLHECSGNPARFEPENPVAGINRLLNLNSSQHAPAIPARAKAPNRRNGTIACRSEHIKIGSGWSASFCCEQRAAVISSCFGTSATRRYAATRVAGRYALRYAACGQPRDRIMPTICRQSCIAAAVPHRSRTTDFESPSSSKVATSQRSWTSEAESTRSGRRRGLRSNRPATTCRTSGSMAGRRMVRCWQESWATTSVSTSSAVHQKRKPPPDSPRMAKRLSCHTWSMRSAKR